MTEIITLINYYGVTEWDKVWVTAFLKVVKDIENYRVSKSQQIVILKDVREQKA